MATIHSDGFNPDAVRAAPALALTKRQISVVSGILHSTLGKTISSFSEQAELDIVETSTEAPVAKVTADAPLRILMVDDDVLILMNSVDMLEDMGFGVTSAHSGVKALEILKIDPTFDLLITDFSMPNMNGLQLAMAVRAFLPQLPILLATGYAELPVNSDLVLPQLSKPYMQSELQSAIKELVVRTGLQ